MKKISMVGGVAHNVAQEPILYFFGPIHIEGPFKFFWAKGESLRLDIFC